MALTPETVDRVMALIAVGHHRDEVPGLPGAALAGEGVFAGDRRLYFRCTAEFAAAASDGLLDRLPAPPPPTSSSAIAEAEALVGAALPESLKELYGIANGGFGPGYGLLGLRGGFADEMGRTALDILTEVPRGRRPGMPAGLLAVCHWGCAIYSFVQCPSGRMFGWDPNPRRPGDDVPYFEQEYTIDTWIEAWLDGSLLQPWLVHEPSTGTYRGATIAETRATMAEGPD